jgi:hypothetical protein
LGDSKDKTGLDSFLTGVQNAGRRLWLDPSCFFSDKTLAVTASVLDWLKTEQPIVPRQLGRYLNEKDFGNLHNFLMEEWGGPRRRPSLEALDWASLRDLRSDYDRPNVPDSVRAKAREVLGPNWELTTDLILGSMGQGAPILAFARSELTLSKGIRVLGGVVLKAGGGVKGGVSRAHAWKARNLYPHLKRNEVKVGLGLVGVSLVVICPVAPLILGAIIIG